MGILPRYALVGGCAAALDLAFFLVFSTWAGFHYLAVGALGFILATLANYLLSIRFVFESGVRFRQGTEISVVFLISLVGLGLHSLLLFLAVAHLEWPGIAGKVFATGLVFFWNFSARNYYVFSRARSGRGTAPAAGGEEIGCARRNDLSRD